MKNEKFAELFPNVKGLWYDSFSKYVGNPIINGNIERKTIMPITRRIDYKKNPSLHKCDARCQNAKGHICECSCGGKYHGINFFG